MIATTVDNKQLRSFGFILASGLIGIFGILFQVGFHKPFATWPYAAGATFLLLAVVRPSLLKVVYRPWMKLGSILGWINTRIILGVIYFVVITPMGLVMRILGKDAMHRTYDPKLDSYRKITPPQPIQHMEKPF